MNKQIANKLIKALYGKVESLRAEAHWVKGTRQECDLVRKALVILKRIGQYELLTSRHSMHDRINLRDMTYLERLRYTNYSL